MPLPTTPFRYFTRDLDYFAPSSMPRLIVVSVDNQYLEIFPGCEGWRNDAPVKPVDQYLLGQSWREVKPPFLSGRAIVDLEATVKEKTREIEKLRAENDQLNSEVLILERKLSYLLSRTPYEGVTPECPCEPKDLCFQVIA